MNFTALKRNTTEFITDLSSPSVNVDVVDTAKKTVSRIVNSTLTSIQTNIAKTGVPSVGTNHITISTGNYNHTTSISITNTDENYSSTTVSNSTNTINHAEDSTISSTEITSDLSIDTLFEDEVSTGVITDAKVNAVKKYLKEKDLEILSIAKTSTSSEDELLEVGSVSYKNYGNLYSYLKTSDIYNTSFLAAYTKPQTDYALTSLMITPKVGYAENFKSLEAAEDSYTNIVYAAASPTETIPGTKLNIKEMYKSLFSKETFPSQTIVFHPLEASFLRYPGIKESVFNDERDGVLTALINRRYTFYFPNRDADIIIDIVAKKSVSLIEKKYGDYVSSIKEEISDAYSELGASLSNILLTDFSNFTSNFSYVGESITRLYNSIISYFTMESLDYNNISNYFVDDVFREFNAMLDTDNNSQNKEKYSLLAYSSIVKTVYMLGKFFSKSTNVTVDDITDIDDESSAFRNKYLEVLTKFKNASTNPNKEKFSMQNIV